MKIDVLTLFPGMFSGPLDDSIITRARAEGLLDLAVHNLRVYTPDRHRRVDEQPVGGGLLEYPQYTRPAEFRGLKVPEVLLSGNHAEIAKWRADQAKKRTREQRPDLLEQKRSDGLME